MNATYFATVNDLRNWVDSAMGPDANDTIIQAVTDWIQRDRSRPNWGREDWSTYLELLDLWHIATQLGL